MSIDSAPGWYADPGGSGALRYWDGVRWTEHVSPDPAGGGAAWSSPVAVTQQAKPARRWKRWLIAGGAVVLLLASLSAFGISRVVFAVKAPADEANRYLALLRDADDAGAYARVCESVRSSVSYEEFSRQLAGEREQFGALKSFNVTKSMVESGGPALINFTAKTESHTFAQQATLVRENGSWHWCGAGPAPKEVGIRFP